MGAMGVVALALAACGGGGSSSPSQGSSPPPPPPPPPTQYSIGGSVTGLSGTGLVLQDNGGDNLAVSASGPFTFATKVNSGAAYSVTIMTQPSGQTCTVASGSGTATANVTNVAVSCTNSASGATIGGTVSGLAGTGLVLQDNGGDNLTVTKNGTFTFATSLASGAAYAVTVATPPSSPSQTCTVTNGSGTTSTSNVTNVSVACSGVFAYVADYTGGNIYAYTIDPTTGELTPAGVSSGLVHPAVVALAPNGKFAFVATNSGTEIHAYAIDQSTGQLTEVPSSAGNPGSPYTITGFTVGTTYADIGVDAQSAHLYIASAGDGKVAGFAIDPTSGALTPLPGSPYPAVAGVDQIPAFSPDGKFVYFLDGATPGHVVGYAIDATSGALTPIPGSPFLAGTEPSWISITPNGKFAYVANRSGDVNSGISAYSVDSTSGALTPLPVPTYSTDEHPQDLTIDASGTHLYVPVANGTTNGTIVAFNINVDGSLAEMTGSGTWMVGILPKFLDVDPTGRFAYASDAATPGGKGVYGFSVDPKTGELTALAGSPFQTGPAGSATASEPDFITVGPAGKFGYTSDVGTGTITGFAIDQTTGVLTPTPKSPYLLPSGSDPIFVSIWPEAPGIRD